MIYMVSMVSFEDLRKFLEINVNIEGASSWFIRELIEYIDEYMLSSIGLLLDENLPKDMEYEVLENKTLCDLGFREPDCEKTFIIALYASSEEKPIAYIVFDRVIGDNTYYFKLRKIMPTTL